MSCVCRGVEITNRPSASKRDVELSTRRVVHAKVTEVRAIPRWWAMESGKRWADIVDERAPASPPVRPLSVPLTAERSWTQCAKCGASFYLNSRGKPRKFCKDCYLTWSRTRYKSKSKKTHTSPSSSTAGSSGAGEEAGELLVGLQRVLTGEPSFDGPEVTKKILSRPPPPPPPPAPLPQPLDVTALLTVLSNQPPPKLPALPETHDVGCQTGVRPANRRPANRRPVTPPLSAL